MLLFSHIGLTIGAAIVIKRVYSLNRNRAQQKASAITAHASTSAIPNVNASLQGLFDLRWWITGSILPDIIDKPLGFFLFNNGRIYSHTLLFAVLIFTAGLCLALSHRKKWLLGLSFGIFIHLILDFIWLNPQTFLWPFQGLYFPSYDNSNWLADIFQGLFNNPLIYIPEITGLLITAAFTWKLVHGKYLLRFIKYGEMPVNLV